MQAASPDDLVRRLPAVYVHMSDHRDQVLVQAKSQLVEVKCPYAARDMTVGNAVQACKDFFLDKYFLARYVITRTTE